MRYIEIANTIINVEEIQTAVETEIETGEPQVTIVFKTGESNLTFANVDLDDVIKSFKNVMLTA